MSQLRLYNTLTRKKEDFVPLDAKNVRMYVCGPTVYDFAHIGNARPVIVFDVLFRLLRHLYGEKHVTYVRNITDVDDKINARAQELAKEKKISVEDAIREITTKTAKQYEDDVTALGCLKPTQEPRATDHIKQMITLIEKLVAAKHAYVAEGHVLFDVSSKHDYGKLSRRSLDEMIAGARVEVAPYKRNPMDFVLWKPSPPELPGWDSPWGRGRPGWHVECSAMAEAYLGETFDIHGGGIDLLFPHHENEIAQSESANPKSHFAHFWLHNGFLQVEGDKMSKSLGNFVTIRDLLKHWQGEVLRLAMLMTHYRQPINWTRDGMSIAKAKWQDLAGAVRNVHPSNVPEELVQILADDLNTPLAISYLHTLKDRAGSSLETARQLSASLLFLGVIKQKFAHDLFTGHLRITAPPDVIFKELISQANGDAFVSDLVEAVEHSYGDTVDERVFEIASKISPIVQIRDIRTLEIDVISVAEVLDARNAAREAKNFKEADRIRHELESKGIILKDNSDGTTTWEVKR